MKKKSKKVVKKGKSLKKLKEEVEKAYQQADYESALSLSKKIIECFPKNIYGYKIFIKIKTNDYKKYLDEQSIKEVKEVYEKGYEIASKNEKKEFKNIFCEYLDDCKEVENLKKVRKEIITKFVLKNEYNNVLAFINQNINTAKSYNYDGKKIKNIYDFIKGLFFVSCLIYNLIFTNYLLFITIPFGIFGIINIYSFIDMNFLKKGKLKSDLRRFEEMIGEATEKTNELKREVEKINENIEFLDSQKNSVMSKIPESFSKDISSLFMKNEKEIAGNITDRLTYDEDSEVNNLLQEYTVISKDDLKEKFSFDINNDNSKLSKFIINKINERNANQNEAMAMKKVKPFNIILLFLFSFISVSTIIIVINNFYNLNFKSFVLAIFIGVISTFIYNIDTGKHNSLIETFNDNLSSCVFHATLVYDLIYISITNELSFTYGIIEMPILFILIFMGFVMIISLLKYNYLLKKLRG